MLIPSPLDREENWLELSKDRNAFIAVTILPTIAVTLL
jgi:hypothetical protein